MKNKNIKRINKIGKAAKIVTRIAMVFVIIGSVLSMIGGIFVVTIDENKIRVEGNVDAKVYLTDVKVPGASLLDNENGSLTLDDTVEIGNNSVKIEDFLTLHLDMDETAENEICLNLNGNLGSDLDLHEAKIEAALKAFGKTLMLAALAVGLGFAAALGKALEKCETPFSEDIVRRMKRFGFSMIPYAVLGGIGGAFGIALCVIVLLLMIFIFSYGCSIQTENDDMV